VPQGTVILVDDDASVRKALQRLIRAAGYEVESFADAAEYLARPAPSPPACIVLDIRMPVMTGFDLKSAIAGTGRALPVVFITGHGDEDVRIQALEAGAVDVLFKPIDEESLVDAIERALAPRQS
jgi:FixJ family two-component response regulator